MATDAQETQAMDMSPVAKTWMENPPAEIPVDQSTPKRFGRVPTQVEASGASAPEPSVPEPSVAEPSVPEPSVAEPSVPEPSPTEPPLEKSGSVEVVDVEGGMDNTAKDVGEGDQKTGDEDLFHANEVVTRKDQFDERNALNAEAKKRSKETEGGEGLDDEEGDEEPKPKTRSKGGKTKAEKQKAAREKAKAKKAAKAEKEKQKKKAAAEKKKAAKEAKAAKIKAAKEAKVTKAKAKAVAKKGKNAGSKRRKNQETKDEESEPLPESHEEVPAPAAPAMPEQDPAHDRPAVEAPADDPEVASNQAVHGGDGDDGAGGEAGGRKSFARRYRPERSDPAARFDAIKDNFNLHLKHLLNKVSTMEAHWWISGTTSNFNQFLSHQKNLHCGVDFFPMEVTFWNHCMKHMKSQAAPIQITNYPSFIHGCIPDFLELEDVKRTWPNIDLPLSTKFSHQKSSNPILKLKSCCFGQLRYDEVS